MSRENAGEELTRTHLYLNAEDLEWFKSYFQQNIGLSKAVRAVMRSYRNTIEAEAGQKARRHIAPAKLSEEIIALATEDTGK